MNRKLHEINRDARSQVRRAGGKAIMFNDIDPRNMALYRYDCIHLSPLGLDIFVNILRGSLEYFDLFPTALIFPRPDARGQ